MARASNDMATNSMTQISLDTARMWVARVFLTGLVLVGAGSRSLAAADGGAAATADVGIPQAGDLAEAESPSGGDAGAPPDAGVGGTPDRVRFPKTTVDPAAFPATEPVGPAPTYKERPSEIQETVVTTGRRAEAVFDSPRATSVVGRRQMDERAVRTTPEALEATPGVFVQQSNHGGGAPIVRGQLGNRLLLLVDGIRLNNATYRAGPNQFLNTVDSFAVDRIEVLRGSGSVANGSDAIGGTINVITESPRLGPAGGPRAHLQLRAGSVDQSGAVGGRGAWSNDRIGFVASGSARHFGDLRAGGGVLQPFTGYDEWSAMFTGAWEPKEGRRLTLSFQTTRQYDVPRSDRSFPRDFRLFALQVRQLAYLRFEQIPGASALSRLRTTVSWNRQGEKLDRYRLDRDAKIRDQAVIDTFGLQLEMDVDAHLPSGKPLTVGFDVYLDRIRTDASEGLISSGPLTLDPLAARYPSGVGYATAALFFVHDVVATERYRMTMEGRLGGVRISLPEDSRVGALVPTAAPLPSFSELVPVYAAGLHGRRALGSHVAAVASGTLGFRAPNVDDYARLGVEGPAFVIPTRGLRPERAWSGEIGLKGEWERARFSAAYAYTRISDALLRSPAMLPGLTTIDDLPIGQVRNTESASYHSVEGSAVVDIWRRLSLSAQGAYTRGSVTAAIFMSDPTAPRVLATQPASKVPPLFGRLGLAWRGMNGRWFSEAALRFALAQTHLGDIDLSDARICPDVPGTCSGTPAWASVGVRAGLRLANAVRLVLVFDNLTDARYRSHASGIDAPGRNAVLMLEGYL